MENDGVLSEVDGSARSERVLLVDMKTGGVRISNRVTSKRCNQSLNRPSPSNRPKRQCTTRKNYDVSTVPSDECSDIEEEPQELNTEHDVGWKCSVNGCSSIVKHVKNKKRHLIDYHGILLPNGKYRRDRVQCLLCSKVVLNASNLNIHHELKHANLAKKFKNIQQHSLDRIKFS